MWAAILMRVRANPQMAMAVGLIALVLLIGGGLYLKGRMDKGADVKRDSAVAEQKADTRKAVADGRAALSEVASKAAAAQLEKDLKHADDAAPNALPSRARLAHACEWMRAQGADDAAVSRCLASPTRD